MQFEVMRNCSDQVIISIGRVTLGEKARKDMISKERNVSKKKKGKGKDKTKNEKEKQENEEKEDGEEEVMEGKIEKQKEAIIGAACALLNSGGGVIRIEAEDQHYDYSTDGFGQDLLGGWNDLVHPARMNDYFEFRQEGKELLMFVKSWCSLIKPARICSISTGLYRRFGSSARKLLPPAANEFLQRAPSNSEIPANAKVDRFYARNTVNANETLDFGESSTVEFKDFREQTVLDRLRSDLPKYISAFANTEGGFLFVGVDDKGRVTGCGEGESEEELKRCVEEIWHKAIKVHRHKCKTGRSLSVEPHVIHVLGENVTEPKSYVLAIKILPFCCDVFEKCPDSWQIKDSELCQFTAEQWLKMMESTDPENELIGYFKQLSIKDTPPQCRTVYGLEDHHLESLQEKLFPVDSDDISIGPEPLLKVLFGQYENLRKLQTLERREDGPGVLIFSRSWAVDIGRVRNSHVVCDAMLICQNSLPCLYTVVDVEEISQDVGEISQDAWEYATSTAFHLKQKLVNIGGCRERICVVPKLVNCHTGELIPREQNSLGWDLGTFYPASYMLRSKDQIRSVLRSLVIVLMSFTSALCDELGSEFLNLLTEEQFVFLRKHGRMRELFIHGLPGSGKTLLAAEKIKRIKNDKRCENNNVLYICENKPLKDFMSKKNICICETRVSFMTKSFPDVQHIIVDEGQNFRSENGNWIQKAKGIVKDDGVFWVFLDYFQINHTVHTGLPLLEMQNIATLHTIVRNSERVSEFLRRELDGICKRSLEKGHRLANHLKEMFSELRFIHSFSGSFEVQKMAKSEVVTYLLNKLLQFLDEGRSSKDIAILWSTLKDRDEYQLDLETKGSDHGILFTSAECMDRDAVVIDSIRRFSGLEKNIVFLIDLRVHPFLGPVGKNLLVAAISRARIQLIVISLISPRKGGDPFGNKTDSPGKKRPHAEDKRDPSGDKTDSPGEKRPHAEDKRDPSGNKRDSPGDKTDSPGEKRPHAEDKRDSPGKKRDSPGEKRDSPGEKRPHAEDKRDSPGKKRDSPGEKRPHAEDKRDPSGEKTDSPGEKRPHAEDKRDPSGEKTDSPGEKRPHAEDKRDPSGEKTDSPGEKRPHAEDKIDPSGNKRGPAGSGSGLAEDERMEID